MRSFLVAFLLMTPILSGAQDYWFCNQTFLPPFGSVIEIEKEEDGFLILGFNADSIWNYYNNVTNELYLANVNRNGNLVDYQTIDLPFSIEYGSLDAISLGEYFQLYSLHSDHNHNVRIISIRISHDGTLGGVNSRELSDFGINANLSMHFTGDKHVICGMYDPPSFSAPSVAVLNITDQNLQIQDSLSFNPSHWSEFLDCTMDKNGNILLTGCIGNDPYFMNPPTFSNIDGLNTSISSQGQVNWWSATGTSHPDMGMNILSLRNGDFAVYERDILWSDNLTLYDCAGVEIWSIDVSLDNPLYSSVDEIIMYECSNGDIVLGNSEIVKDYYLTSRVIRVNRSGSIRWSLPTSYPFIDISINSILEDYDGGLLIGGSKISYTGVNVAPFFAKIVDEEFDPFYEFPKEELPRTSDAQWYPNPANESITFSISELTEVTLFSTDGKEVAKYFEPEVISVSLLPAGNYILELTDSSGSVSREKLIIAH